MPNESNILSASIELSLRSIEKGAKAIQTVVDNVNDAADFEQVKNEFSSLANRVAAAATTIKTEIGKITNAIDLSQVAKNLQHLDDNVEKIVNNIDAYMEKMSSSMEDANKVTLSEVKNQLTDLQESIKKFSTLTKSDTFLNAFKSDDVQNAASAFRDYATALKNITSIDVGKLQTVLNGLTPTDANGKAIKGIAGVDLSPITEQMKDFGYALDGLTNVDRKITALANAIERLSAVDGSADGNVFDKLSESLDTVREKALLAREAASGVDIDSDKIVADDKKLSNMSNSLSAIYKIMSDLSGIKFNRKTGGWEYPDVLQPLTNLLDDIKSNIIAIGKEITDAIAKGSSAPAEVRKLDSALNTTKQKALELSEAMSTLKKNSLTATQVKNLQNFSTELSKAAGEISGLLTTVRGLTKEAKDSSDSTVSMVQSYDKISDVLTQLKEVSKVTGDIVEQFGAKLGVSGAEAENAAGQINKVTTATTKANKSVSSKTNIDYSYWTACRKIDSEIKHPPVVELRKTKL